MLDKDFQRKVLGLRVFCSNKEEGCRWEGELRDLETHSRRGCAYVEEECRYQCGVRYQRRLLRDHEMDECPQRPPEVVTQSLVRKMAEKIDKLDKAHESKLAVVEAKLAGVEQHIQQLQKDNVTLRNEKEKVTEKMEELVRQQQQAKDKQAKLSKQIQELQKQNTLLEGEKTMLTRKMGELETRLQEAINAQHEGQAKLAAVQKIHHQEQVKLSQQIQQLQQQNTSLEGEKTKVTRKVEELDTQLQQELDKDKAGIHELEEEKKMLSKKIDDLESQVQQQRTQIHPLITQSPGWVMDPKGTLSSPHPPCIIVMPKFSQHKKDGDRWYSQPFYSAKGGYKLCLIVDANGNGRGEGTHISVFVCLVKGENDLHLSWPFEHNIKYRILNWKKDDDHVAGSADFRDAPTGCKQRVTSKERAATGKGSAKLLPHTSLYDSSNMNVQYLHNDCLCLQVLNVEPPK